MRLGRRGFSLVEIMVTISLMGATAYIMMQLNKNQSEAMKRIISDFDIQSAISNMKTQLKRPEVCNHSLSGRRFDSTEDLIIQNDAGTTLYQIGQKVGDVKIVKLTTTPDDIKEDGAGTLKVAVQFERPRGAAGNKISKVYNILILANTANGQVSKCFSDDELSVTNFCTAMGGTMTGTTCMNLNGNYLAPGSVTILQLADGSVSTTKLVDGSVSMSKLELGLKLGEGGAEGTGGTFAPGSNMQAYRCPIFSNGTDTSAGKECGNICETSCFGQVSTTQQECSYYVDQKISSGCKCIKDDRYQVTEKCEPQL